MPFRQNSQFFYLTGVAEPRAVVIIDGRTKTTTLFLAPKNDRREQSMFGPALSPGPEAVTDTGIDDVRPRDELTAALDQITNDHRTVFTPFAAEVLGSQSSGRSRRGCGRANKRDPWDGRDSREQTFIAKLKAASPDLDDQGPRSDRQRAARGEEPARDRGHPRGDAHRRARHHGGDAGRAARHARIRAPGRRRVRVQEERGASARRTSRSSPRARTRTTRTTTRTRRRSRTATSSSSTTRPTSSTTSRTSRACSRPTASSRRASASSTASTSSSTRR